VSSLTPACCCHHHPSRILYPEAEFPEAGGEGETQQKLKRMGGCVKTTLRNPRVIWLDQCRAKLITYESSLCAEFVSISLHGLALSPTLAVRPSPSSVRDVRVPRSHTPSGPWFPNFRPRWFCRTRPRPPPCVVPAAHRPCTPHPVGWIVLSGPFPSPIS
jgi:hypothetical protein